MFELEVDKESFAIKPMNCPGHCLIYGRRERSYRELPIRMADFGVLHRNEASGALTGLTRVRRFQQDDGHIFCRLDQLGDEIDKCLDFLKNIYELFGFSFSLKLSTRPKNYLGEIEKWDEAESFLKDSLDKFGYDWKLNPGDGAFYGPKIDITISDALKREHQCATIQLDFQLPQRFKLNYRTSDPNNQFDIPVMIHRAVFGSVERMLAILMEHYAGKWPFWLSPRQIIIIPVSETNDSYAKRVCQIFHEHGFFVEVDSSTNPLNKKIRNAEISQINYIFVVGLEEEKYNSVNVRMRDQTGSKTRSVSRSIDSVIDELIELKDPKASLKKS
jgi:threonyl-tRNA synthetase